MPALCGPIDWHAARERVFLPVEVTGSSSRTTRREATQLLLQRLERAQSDYRESEKQPSVTCATTGAGKTVMAAAGIEARFYGNDADADDGAVVVWFCDNPDLNDQTRNRLIEASDKLTASDLVTVEYPSPRRGLAPEICLVPKYRD